MSHPKQMKILVHKVDGSSEGWKTYQDHDDPPKEDGSLTKSYSDNKGHNRSHKRPNKTSIKTTE